MVFDHQDDNDRVIADLQGHLEREFGTASAARYWAIFDGLRSELGYADYLGALQRYRLDAELGEGTDQRLLQMSAFLIDYPFADRLYPRPLEVIERLSCFGPTVILSDGDVVFQPRKVRRSGLCRKLHDLGQRIWLDNITREMLNNGTLARYIAELSVTGLTSNPTIFEHAIGSGDLYDAAIQKLAAQGLPCEDIFFELALQDLTQAADLFRPIFDASRGSDGWVSLEVSPLLANEHYVAAAHAYLRGIERRIEAGLDPNVESVASLFVSRWDVVVKEDVQPQLHNRLGVAIAMRTYKAHCDLLASERWQRLAAAGARPQRLLWASTGTKDPAAPDTFYVEALAAADTIDTIPEKTLLAFADHGKVGVAWPADGGYAEGVLDEFKREGVDDESLAAKLQREGVQAFAKSWSGLMARIREKSSQPAAAAESAGTA